jgi:hypothetical protein
MGLFGAWCKGRLIFINTEYKYSRRAQGYILHDTPEIPTSKDLGAICAANNITQGFMGGKGQFSQVIRTDSRFLNHYE